MKIRKALIGPALAAGMFVAGTGIAAAATQTLNFNNVNSNQNTTEHPTAVGTHSIKATDCGGPVEVKVFEDVFGPDLFEGSNTPVCNSGTAATIFGTRDSRDSGDRGHYVKNASSQRIDINWKRPT